MLLNAELLSKETDLIKVEECIINTSINYERHWADEINAYKKNDFRRKTYIEVYWKLGSDDILKWIKETKEYFQKNKHFMN